LAHYIWSRSIPNEHEISAALERAAKPEGEEFDSTREADYLR
jgi:hypothetical protein